LLCVGVQGRKVLLQGGAVQPYDVLSINVGITPAASSIPGAAQHTTPVKPIDK
jgi:selenide,water dikinase